jgi:hypothetical protein
MSSHEEQIDGLLPDAALSWRAPSPRATTIHHHDGGPFGLRLATDTVR